MAQTNEVVRRLRAAWPGLAAEAAPFSTRGDRDQTGKLDRHGGKGGAFVAEIRRALRDGELAAAMHSLKDVPGNEVTPGLVLAALLPRDPASDALVLRPGLSLDEVRARAGAGVKIGTNAVRRAAYLRRLYPAAEVIHYRGAADTRIRKLDAGEKQKLPGGGEVGPADALVMATSGLRRVGLADRIAHEFTADEILPAAGQGVIAVECVETAWDVREKLAALDDPDARACADAEREVLWVLDGHCNSPIAAHAVVDAGTLRLRAAVIREDGARVFEVETDGAAGAAREVGRTAGLALRAQGAGAVIDATRPPL